MTLRDSDILDLPEAPDFISRPPVYTVAEMIALCEKMLPFWNAQRYSKPEEPFTGEPFTIDSATNAVADAVIKENADLLERLAK